MAEDQSPEDSDFAPALAFAIISPLWLDSVPSSAKTAAVLVPCHGGFSRVYVVGLGKHASRPVRLRADGAHQAAAVAAVMSSRVNEAERRPTHGTPEREKRDILSMIM